MRKKKSDNRNGKHKRDIFQRGLRDFGIFGELCTPKTDKEIRGNKISYKNGENLSENDRRILPESERIIICSRCGRKWQYQRYCINCGQRLYK